MCKNRKSKAKKAVVYRKRHKMLKDLTTEETKHGFDERIQGGLQREASEPVYIGYYELSAEGHSENLQTVNGNNYQEVAKKRGKRTRPTCPKDVDQRQSTVDPPQSETQTDERNSDRLSGGCPPPYFTYAHTPTEASSSTDQHRSHLAVSEPFPNSHHWPSTTDLNRSLAFRPMNELMSVVEDDTAFHDHQCRGFPTQTLPPQLTQEDRGVQYPNWNTALYASPNHQDLGFVNNPFDLPTGSSQAVRYPSWVFQ